MIAQLDRAHRQAAHIADHGEHLPASVCHRAAELAALLKQQRDEARRNQRKARR